MKWEQGSILFNHNDVKLDSTYLDNIMNDVIKQLQQNRYRMSQLMCQLMRMQQQRIETALILEDVDETSSDDQDNWGGRQVGTKNFPRGECNWIKDYIGPNSTYPCYLFRRRFSIPKVMYEKLKQDLLQFNNDVWKTRKNGFGKVGIPTDVKILACLRVLSTGCSYDSLDDVVYMSEQRVKDYFVHFCEDVVSMYGTKFINRLPTMEELTDITERYKAVGCPGCIGAIDCMKMTWSKCPAEDKGQYMNTNDSKMATVQCEAWCDHDLYCWHWHPGRVGTNNDITVLYRSPLFRKILRGEFNLELETSFKLGETGRMRKMGYFLVDGIYPSWPIFAKPIHQPITEEEGKYSAFQEAVRKDVERLFGVLQTRFEILRREIRKWELDSIIQITNVCVLLHNMIIRMHQNGEFEEEAGGINVVTELLEEEEQMRGESYMEFEENRRIIEQQIVPNVDEEIERLLVREMMLTSQDGHMELMEEMIRMVDENAKREVGEHM